MQKFLLLISLLAILSACSRPDRDTGAAVDKVSLTTDDGICLGATVYTPATKGQPPGLVLVHRYGRNRTVWEGFARAAQQAGLLVVTVDLRGHGESGTCGDTTIHHSQLTEKDILDSLHDIEAAKNYLLDRGADPNNLAVTGEGLGANLALQYTLQSPDIQAVVMISPGLEYNGVETERAITRLVDCPALLIASEGDAYSALSVSALKQNAPVFTELRTWSGASHGVDIFASHLESMQVILQWLERIFDAA